MLGVLSVCCFLVTYGTARADLPDRRAYEQVSPVTKGGADVMPHGARTRAASNGDAVQFVSLTGFGDVEGTALTAEYVAVRGDDGRWASHGITPTQEPVTLIETFLGLLEPRYMGEFSDDLSHGVYLAHSSLTDAPNVAAVSNAYLRDDLLSPGPGVYRLLSDASTPQQPSDPFSAIPQPFVADASESFTHVLFESRRNLTDDAVAANLDTGEPKLYKWVNGTVSLVGILPASEGGAPTASQAGQGALSFGYTKGTISADGTRAIFTAPPYASGHSAGVVYLRDDEGFGSGTPATIRVSTSERTDCNSDPTCGGDSVPNLTPDPSNPGGVAPPATFWAATADASQVFFTTSEQLSDDDIDGGEDLYRFDLESPPGEQLTLLSVDNQPADGGEEVHGVLGASIDGDYVYFISSGQLAAGGTTDPTGGPIGGERIYVWHDGELDEVGAVNGGVELGQILGRSGWGNPKLSRVSPDGTHLTFITEGTDELLSLYGAPEYDHGDTCENLTNLDCQEVYVYEASDDGGDLRCASCNPTGAKATVDASYYGTQQGLGAARDSAHLNHVLSDDGRFVFFNSAEQLTPSDHNRAIDAYEYDTSTDEVQLISSGTGDGQQIFVDASTDGRDAFFTTREQLSVSDVDQSRDIYDARVGGVAEIGAPKPKPCEGDACRPTSPPRQERSTPPSVNAEGPGDEVAARGAPPVFWAKPLTSKQLGAFAKRGRARLLVRMSEPGALAVRLVGRVDGKRRVLQKLGRTFARGDQASVRLRLGRAGLRELVKRDRLQLKLIISYSPVPAPQIIHLTLRNSHA